MPDPHLPRASNAIVVNVGPTRAIKSLDTIKWPKKGATPVVYLLDASDTPYTLSKKVVIDGNVTIEPADWDHRPSIKLMDSFVPKTKGSSSYVAYDAAFKVNGTFTVRAINTLGGDNIIFLGSTKSAVIDCEFVNMDGGAVWRGTGAKDVYFLNNDTHGKPRGNVYSSYTEFVDKCVIDNSGTDTPVPQGGIMVNGNPIGESPIRIMNVNNCTIIGVTTKPWFYKPGKIWKQDVQLRPASNKVTLVNCHFYLPDIGDMTWRKPAKRIEYVEFVNCILDKSPLIHAGTGTVKYTTSNVSGKMMTKTSK